MTRKVSGRLQSFSFSVLPSVCLNPRPVRRTRTFDFYPPPTPGKFCFGIGDEAHVFWPSSAHSGRSPPTRRDLASDTWTPHPRSRNTSCFRPFSMQAAKISHILLSIASYYYAQEQTRPAKEWLAKLAGLSCNEEGVKA